MMEKNTVFLSIVITTFKRQAWLKECLNSIYQSCSEYYDKGGEKKIEIIVCDDDPGQTNTDELTSHTGLKSIGVDFNYHINEANLGDYFNRNKGISLAKGNWVKFIDDDDLIYSWSIKFMVEKLSTSKDANTVIFYLRDNFRHLKFPVILKNEEILKFHYQEYGLFHCSLVSAVFLREDLLRHKAFKFKRFYGDFQLFHDMAINGVFYIYPIELGWYRIHEAQESSNNRKMVLIRFNYLLFSLDHFLNKDRFEKPYVKSLLSDSIATLKYSLKKLYPYLFFQSIFIIYVLKIKSEKQRRSDSFMRKWEKYYKAKMLYADNEIVFTR